MRLPRPDLASKINNIPAETIDETFSQQSSNNASAVFAASIGNAYALPSLVVAKSG